MSEPLFQIVFRGKLTGGADPTQVRANLMRLFRLDDARVDALLASSKAVIKSGVDKATAQRIQQAFREAGAVVAVVSDAPLMNAKMSALRPQSNTAAVTRPGSAEDGDAPEPEVEPEIVTDINLAILLPPGSRLARAERIEAPVVADSHLSMSEPGVTLVEASKPEPPQFPDSHLSIAELGVTLAEAQKIVAPEIPDSQFSLAESGVVIVPQVRPPAPNIDIAHINLEPLPEPESEDEEEDEELRALRLALLSDLDGDSA